jgi:hypothetical protein
VLDVTPGIFEEEQAESDRRGGTLALAPLASSSQEFEERACSGEFDQAPITFRDADGKPAALRPDIEALRDQAAELKRNGPVHRRPSHPVEIFPADEPEVTAKAVVAEDEEPETQMLADHPRVYKVPKLHPYKPRVHHYWKEERNIGTGREGVGEGPDPSKRRGAQTARWPTFATQSPESRHAAYIVECPLSANTSCEQVQQTARLFDDFVGAQ